MTLSKLCSICIPNKHIVFVFASVCAVSSSFEMLCGVSTFYDIQFDFCSLFQCSYWFVLVQAHIVCLLFCRVFVWSKLLVGVFIHLYHWIRSTFEQRKNHRFSRLTTTEIVNTIENFLSWWIESKETMKEVFFIHFFVEGYYVFTNWRFQLIHKLTGLEKI